MIPDLQVNVGEKIRTPDGFGTVTEVGERDVTVSLETGGLPTNYTYREINKVKE